MSLRETTHVPQTTVAKDVNHNSLDLAEDRFSQTNDINAHRTTNVSELSNQVAEHANQVNEHANVVTERANQVNEQVRHVAEQVRQVAEQVRQAPNVQAPVSSNLAPSEAASTSTEVTAEPLHNTTVEGAPELPSSEKIEPPPNLDELFSEESIRKLRESIENSPCYKRRVALYQQQQQQQQQLASTQTLNLGPSSSMISPLFKLQFFASYAKGVMHYIQNHYVALIVVFLLMLNAYFLINYFKNTPQKGVITKRRKF
ncbi:skeleton-binding protein 1, putative [Plasmodium malariae]|uniref:Skeleton-binding protein 1, putative n=1 Tax=Plasmodium malariae TaxID=5858 RepID=A0A1D3JK36_PLAMA|nr:skeleton-binding protein 1, putative [Plasmodium malariae]SBT86762.1 skeleton-binding protein 1, putative [Plasmodium malariae]